MHDQSPLTQPGALAIARESAAIYGGQPEHLDPSQLAWVLHAIHVAACLGTKLVKPPPGPSTRVPQGPHVAQNLEL